MPPPPPKKRKSEPAKAPKPKDVEDVEMQSGSENSGAEEEDWTSSSDNTENEIAQSRNQKSKKTSKRKHRATSPTQFGAALESLLSATPATTFKATGATDAVPLALKPSINRRRNEEKLDVKARKIVAAEKREHEEVGRVRDVIGGGWGIESERALRKIAQRGVVQLFNAIQTAQTAAANAEVAKEDLKGTGKPRLPAPQLGKPREKGKGKQKPNVLGSGKEVAVDKQSFMDAIRAGGVVSTA